MSNENNKQALENTIGDVVELGVEVVEVATEGVVETIVDNVVELGESAIEAMVSIIAD
ncbi:MAG: hypothetical protein FD167_2076 [bacterium]|nr:MAG: hypothetical protein FD167_2076 [bacterium]